MLSTIKKNYILFLAGILIIILYTRYGIGIPCIFFELTGLYCPGCGITRALISLVQLDFYQAFRYNMLVMILLIFSIIYGSYIFVFKGKKKLPNIVWYFTLIITILYGVLRNIPTFSFLAPTIV